MEKEPNGTGGILRITQEGQVVGNGILGKRISVKSIFCVWNTK